MQAFRKIDWISTLTTLAIGFAGGTLAHALHLPLAYLMGSLLAVGITAALELRPFKRTVFVPPTLRMIFIPIIGVAIGGNFTPQVLAQMPGWWPSLLALLLYIPLAHWLGYRFYRRFGPLPPATAYFGAVPGGLIESVMLGEEAGADPRLLVLLQFLRLILTIFLVPLAFLVLTDIHVAAGMPMKGGGSMTLADLAILTAAGVTGVLIATRLRFPAAPMTGAIAMSAIVHIAGFTDATPPGWAIAGTQMVVGTVLGARFAGLPRAHLWLAGRLAFINVAMGLALASVFAFVLSHLTALPAPAIFLAFAPGGLTEMSLIALSIQLSVVYVTAHHVARIVLSVTVAKAFAHRILKG